MYYNNHSTNTMFLFSGQSNMEGYTIGPGSIEHLIDPERDLFQDILLILYDYDDDDLLSAKQQAISNRIEDATPEEKTTSLTNLAASTEAELIMNLYQLGLMDNITEPLIGKATCSYYNPKRGDDPPAVDDATSSRWVSPHSQCGKAFGPELMFSHVLSKYYQDNNEDDDTNVFHIAKVVAPGTQLYDDWFPGVSKYWDALNYTIHHQNTNEEGQWNGFVWYQGENDCLPQRPNNEYHGEDTSRTYLGNLTNFVETVRTEIVNSGNSPYIDPSDIPVAIIQVGPKPGGRRCDRVREAQSEFVRSSNNSIIIQNLDLSRFYHLDAPSQLIIGSRLANQWIRKFLIMN